jgi:hypothetical protein
MSLRGAGRRGNFGKLRFIEGITRKRPIYEKTAHKGGLGLFVYHY